MEETLPLRRSARPVSSDVCDPRGMVAALNIRDRSRVPAKTIGTFLPLASGQQGSHLIPGTHGALSMGDEAFPPCGRPPHAEIVLHCFL